MSDHAPILKLHAADEVTPYTAHPGKRLFTFHGITGLNPRLLRGSEVEIDGERFYVHGAETHAVINPTGHNFGLLVTKSEDR